MLVCGPRSQATQPQLVHTLTPNRVRDSHYNPYIHWPTLQILFETPINVIIKNRYSIPAIHNITTIYTYI